MTLEEMLRGSPLNQQRMADDNAMNLAGMLARGRAGTVRQEPSLMQEIGGAITDYAVPDRYLPSSVMEPRLDMNQLESLRGTPVDMADVPDPVPMLMDTMPMAGITAWHGSPHKFSKFDMSKIGTGEGAQAYGHGIYAAESPNVAKNYAPRDFDYEESLMDAYKRHEQQGDYEAMEIYERAMMHETPAEIRASALDPESVLYGMQDTALRVADEIAEIPINSNLYKVDIPDDQIAKMLDWDKPLKDQPQSVKDFVKQRKQLPNLKKSYKDFGGAKMTGHEIHQWLKSGSGVGLDNPKSYGVAENQLLGGGVPGIKYLDGGSRSGGQGTSNFVLFADDIAKILERNDQPIGDLAEELQKR